MQGHFKYPIFKVLTLKVLKARCQHGDSNQIASVEKLICLCH